MNSSSLGSVSLYVSCITTWRYLQPTLPSTACKNVSSDHKSIRNFKRIHCCTPAVSLRKRQTLRGMQACVRTRKKQGMPPYLSSPQISSVADRPTDRQADKNMHGPPVKDFEAQRRVVVFPHGANLAQTAHERHKCQLVTYFKQCLSVGC